MGIGAIVLVDAESQIDVRIPSTENSAPRSSSPSLTDGPLAFLDILGRSLLEIMIDRFAGGGVEATSLLIQADVASVTPAFHRDFDNLAIYAVRSPWVQIVRALQKLAESGIEYALITRPSAYLEVDIADLIRFHCEGRTAVTRAIDADGPLDLWVVDCDAPFLSDWEGLPNELAAHPNSYFVDKYVKRVTHPRDLRQLATDAFLAKCQIRPCGRELRPGVWAGEGIEVHRGARIVAPAYIGAGARVEENALITRFSSVESFCYVDYGTAIENSTILPNTYVGISLDVRHAIVYENRLLDLNRDVVIETSDSNLFRPVGVKAIAKLPVIDWLDVAEARLTGNRDRPNNPPASIPSVSMTTEFEA